jgi:hypothetical protein
MFEKTTIDRDLELIKHFKSKYKLNIEKACFSTGWIPNYIILDRTRNIHSYCVFIFQEDFTFTNDFINKDLIEFSKIRYSSLDRPLFIFLISNDLNIKFFEIEEFKNLLEQQKLNKLNLNNLWVDFDSMSSAIKAEQ